MRKLTGLLGLAMLASPAFAQLNVSQHDGSTDFTSRGIAGNVNGWAFNGYKYDRQGGGIGIGGLQGLSHLMQDQNCTTIETFQFALLEGGIDNLGAASGPGAPVQFPDPANAPIVATAQFASATATNTPCAWIYTTTLGTPLSGGPTGLGSAGDLFTATYLPSNALWTADGASSHISIDQALVNGTGREYANQSVNAKLDADHEFGINWTGGSISSGGVVTGGTPAVAGSRRYWLNRLRYNHTSRSGSTDTTGIYSSAHGAAGPNNFGMAGAYPDPQNFSGVGGAGRADEAVWSDEDFSNFGQGTAFTQVMLANFSLRPIIGQNSSVAPFGNLELLPTDPLFSFGGAVPGLTLVGPVAGVNTYQPQVPLIQSPGAASALGLFFATDPGTPRPNGSMISELSLYAQVTRLDFGTASSSIGSCDSHSFIN